MKIMYAWSDTVHCRIQWNIQAFQQIFHIFILIYCFRSTCQKDRPWQQMPHIIMDFAGNPVSFPKCCCIYFIILFFLQCFVLFCQKKCSFFAVIFYLPTFKVHFIVLFVICWHYHCYDICEQYIECKIRKICACFQHHEYAQKAAQKDLPDAAFSQ